MHRAANHAAVHVSLRDARCVSSPQGVSIIDSSPAQPQPSKTTPKKDLAAEDSSPQIERLLKLLPQRQSMGKSLETIARAMLLTRRPRQAHEHLHP